MVSEFDSKEIVKIAFENGEIEVDYYKEKGEFSSLNILILGKENVIGFKSFNRAEGKKKVYFKKKLYPNKSTNRIFFRDITNERVYIDTLYEVN